MLAKVITLTHSGPSQGFGPVLRYLLRVETERTSPLRPTPESENGPRRIRDDAERLARRAERAEARRELTERFAREQEELRARRQRERGALRRRHEEERRTLAAAHPAQHRRARTLSRAPGHDGRMALALWAFAAAREREALQHRRTAEQR